MAAVRRYKFCEIGGTKEYGEFSCPCSDPFSLVTSPNQLWCIDFKGYFATGDGKRCGGSCSGGDPSRPQVCMMLLRHRQAAKSVSAVWVRFSF
jgi:hypothetical protein